MRSHFYTAFGAFVLGTALALAAAGQGDGAATAASLERLERARTVTRARALEERIAELEAALGKAKAGERRHPFSESRFVASPEAAATVETADDGAATPDGPSAAEHLPTLDELFALVDARDASGLRAASRKLLLAGAPEGFETLTAFLGAESRSPRQALFAHGPLVASLTGLALEDSAATAKLAGWILERAGDAEPALLARLRSLLPAFLGGRGDRFPALRSQFVAYLDDTFRAEGGARLEALDALSELGEPAPADELRVLLLESDDQDLYKRLLAHVVAVEHETGIEALIEFLDTVEDVNHWAVPFALRALAEVESPLAREYVLAWQSAEDAKLRELAELALDSSSLESVVGVLDSPADLAHKRAVLRELASRAPALLEELRLDADTFLPDVREAIKNGGAQNSWSVVFTTDDNLVVNGTGFNPVWSATSGDGIGNGQRLAEPQTRFVLTDFAPDADFTASSVDFLNRTGARVLTHARVTDAVNEWIVATEPPVEAPPERLPPPLPADGIHANAASDSCASCHAAGQ